jgi:D-sedoheptulose 7-phosphate isomerase
MPSTVNQLVEQLGERYGDLQPCLSTIQATIDLLIGCYQAQGKLLICGNGGSAADSEHIVGELMKGFLKQRPVSQQMRKMLIETFANEGAYLADHLQEALPAISLVSQTALMTAYSNDAAPDMVFAQQVYGYGCPNDLLLAISTSGNSTNVLHAVRVARTKGLHTIGLTGKSGGELAGLCDIAICVPHQQVDLIQERHIAVYHVLCAAVETTFFEV